MNRIAVFPGTFDPITKGHQDIINRALPLFDSIIIGIGINTNKQPMFDLSRRMAWIETMYKNESKVSVKSYEGLTVTFCHSVGASYILRGIRSVGDFEYEKAIADMNKALDKSIETIFFACSAEFSSHSSTIVRDVIKHGGNYKQFVPEEVTV